MRRIVTAICALVVGLVAVISVTQSQAAQPALPIRAAFYYPWFPETWGDGTHYHPSLGQYDSSSPAVISSHIASMQSAGIQAGIASWWGQGTKTDSRFPALESAAYGTGFKWTAYYEPEGTGNPSSSQIDADLTYLKHNYVKNHPQWLRVGTKPVLFVYGDATDNCAMVDRWLAANRGRFYLNLKVFSGYQTCAQQPDSWHQYAPGVREDAQLPYSFSISPGFYKSTETTPRLARSVSAFATAAANMEASGATWQLITTFNEWGEGTAIEPATEWGNAYLDALGPQSSPPPTSTPPPTSPPPPTNQTVVIYMENHERSSITTSTSAPWMNGYRAGGIDFTHYYGVSHPSLPNYLALANGSTDGKTGTDSIQAGELSQSPTVWNQLSAKGVPWTVYEESMPSVCSSASTSGSYALKHNPATPFAAVFNSSLCQNVKPYTIGDPLSAGVTFIAPNLCNDMHDCSIATGDSWLSRAVAPMVASGATVVITFDEGDTSTNGGGNVYTVVDGPGIPGRVDAGTYSHYSLLAGIENRYGLTKLGGAATATPLPLR